MRFIIISAWRYSDALHSYSWRGCDGKRMRVVVYAKGSYVELYINNELIETKNIDKYKTHFERIYQSGTIKAIAYDENNNIIGVDVLHTGDDSVSLKATINEDTLNADGQDLLYIDLCIADENGIVNSAGNDEIVIELKGTIALVGFGNASPCSENRYDDNAADFYYGRAQAIIRSAYEKGTGEIEIKSGRYGAVKY